MANSRAQCLGLYHVGKHSVSIVVWVALLLWSSAGSYAQVRIGAYGLLNNVRVAGDAPIGGSWAPVLRFGGGLTADYDLTTDLALTLSAQWERRTTALQYSLPHPTIPRQDTTIDSAFFNTDYISIPVGVRIYSGSRHWYFGTGCIVQILQSTSLDTAGQEVEIQGALRDVDVAVYLSAAYSFHFDPLYPFIELRYQQGLFDLVGSTPTNVLRESPVVRMGGFQLLAGVTWRL